MADNVTIVSSVIILILFPVVRNNRRNVGPREKRVCIVLESMYSSTFLGIEYIHCQVFHIHLRFFFTFKGFCWKNNVQLYEFL